MTRVVTRLVVLIATVTAVCGLVRQVPSPPALPGWFATLPAGDTSTFFPATTRTKKLRQTEETRNAIFARSDAPLRQVLTPQAGQRLQVAFTLLCPPPHACAGGARFNVDAIHGTAREPLLHTRIQFEPSAQHWQTQSIDLSPFSGTAVALELAVDPYGASTASHIGARPPAAIWGEPLLIGGTPRAVPNVILISLDTLRADHLGSYGYARPTSPALDRFAADGVRFNQAMSQSPWTTPSHMSLFTSLYPSAHRVNQTWEYFTKFLQGRGRKRTLADAVTTLPEVLRAHGYRTLALTGGATMTAVLGFAQGFDVYREDSAKLTAAVGTLLGNWLNAFGNDPFFLFFHTFEVHAPYTHLTFAAPLLSDAQRADIVQLVASRDPHDWVTLNPDLVAYLRSQGLFRSEITEALYDGGIRSADDFIDGLFVALRQRGLYDDTLIVLLSDHGEEFGEHHPDRVYSAHGTGMYDQLIHVPLLLRMPSRVRAGTVVGEQVELIDVAPTVLELLGIAAPAAMQGRSLTGLIDGAPDGRQDWARKDWAMCEATSKGAELKALRTPEFKYVMMFDPRDGERSGAPTTIKRELLFDLRHDPGERHPLKRPQQLMSMRTQLETLLRSIPTGARPSHNVIIDADVHERLRALGYTQ